MDWTDLDAFQQLPRVGGLALSPDGSRLVTGCAELADDGKTWVTALWEVDPEGERPAHRLTRGAKGEAGPVFLGDDLLFTAKRGEDETAALWLLPVSGEARKVGERAGGISHPVVGGDRVVVSSATLPGAVTGEDDETRRAARKDRKVSAVLHTGTPIRHWDHDLGPDEPRLLVGAPDGPWTDLTPTPGRALDEAAYDVSPDGRSVVTTWTVSEPRGSRRVTLVVIDAATGEQRVLADGADEEWGDPVLSPDGLTVAAVRQVRSTPHDPGDRQVALIPLAGGEPRVLTGWDRWPTSLTWAGDALLVTADDNGRAPVFRVTQDLAVTRLTTDDGCYSDVRSAGGRAFALRSSYAGPAVPVRFDPEVPGVPQPLQGPAPELALPGRLEDVEVGGLRAWLALPEGEGPHPVVLWIHGGPLASWNAWSWRWCPWLLVARGYAVLMPDPALSTGYGLEHVARGWGDWGGATYDDLMTLLDGALERPDLDGTRTAAMGGSFGGYMANWIAGHTDRFDAIVTHASLWALDQFGPTTDGPWYWGREMTSDMVARNDPSQFADAITSPVLVIHGDKDYRVPIGEGLRLWWDLCSRAEDPATMPHRFLYFPDENHWVLSPGHARVWYETVLAFLGQHVLGEPEVVPELLR